MAPALSMVSATAGEDGGRSVTPEKLLQYGQKITHNLYKIENLHRAFRELPKEDCLYILSHQVTEDFPGHTHSHFD